MCCYLFKNFEVNFSQPSGTSKCNISSWNTLYNLNLNSWQNYSWDCLTVPNFLWRRYIKECFIYYSFLKEHERLMESGVDDEMIYSATSTLMLEILGKDYNLKYISSIHLCFFWLHRHFLCRELSITHGSYKWIIMHEKCGRPDSNGFQLKWRFGTNGNWKNQNPGGRFGATS